MGIATDERLALCDLLEELGPNCPTLCEGWETYDMAAHLVTRDRRPDAGPGLVLGVLHPYTEMLERRRRAGTPYERLVSEAPLRRRPSIDGWTSARSAGER